MNAMFMPGMVSLFTNPFHGARTSLHRFVATGTRGWTGRCLDVGCGSRPYRGILPKNVEQVGLDLDTVRNRHRGLADVFYDGGAFPLESETFDHVICSQVLEHVFKPSGFLAEIRRVLRPGGQMLLTVPFLWPEHEQPWDSQRFTSFGIKTLLEGAGFRIEKLEKSLPGTRALLQVVQARLDQRIWSRAESRRARIAVRLSMSPIHFPLNALGALMEASHRGEADVYLDNLVLARRLE